MGVSTEAAYAERLWTGVETAFAPGFAAETINDVKVSYLDDDGLPHPLARGVHFNVQLDANLNVTVTPIALPVAPKTLVFERDTSALQGTDFENLNRYNATVHGVLFDRAFRILAELKSRVVRSVGPFFTTDSVVDFRPRRLRAADPIDGSDVATKSWVLVATGLGDLAALVAQALAAAAAAAASALEALGYKTAAEAARDRAQAWSDTAEDSNVSGTSEYSSYHWSRKAAAAAAILLPYLTQTDDGIFGDPDTGSTDDGSFP